MKLTDKHVSEKDLEKWIGNYAVLWHRSQSDHADFLVKALLELKQRRAKDRKREANNALAD